MPQGSVLVDLLGKLGARRICSLGIDGGRTYDHAFDDLHFFSTKVKILGVYPAHPARGEG